MSNVTAERARIHPMAPAALLGLALVGLLGCGEPPVMLGPFYRPEQGSPAADLVGSWRVPGQGEATKVLVTAQESGMLALQWHRPEGDWWAEGVVVRVRGQRYLDVGPALDQEEWPSGPNITAHYAFLMDLRSDTLSLRYVDQDGWADALKQLGLPRVYHVAGPRPGDPDFGQRRTLVLAYSADSLQMLMDTVMRSNSSWNKFQLIRQREPQTVVAKREELIP
jgi:hypothetical protein